MCRMIGVIAASPMPVRVLMRDAPRSLATLSAEHGDGWGVATFAEGRWHVRKAPSRADGCALFDAVASETRAHLVIAHVRQKTVGESSLVNTHPFERDGLVLAHNGTVRATARLAVRTSSERSRQIEGDTDSERLFAFLLTRIDEARDVASGLHAGVRELCAIPDVGAATFLCSDGRTLFAFVLGRSLYVLDRVPDARVGASRRTPAVLVASEPPTSEPWRAIEPGTLVPIAAPFPIADTVRAPA